MQLFRSVSVGDCDGSQPPIIDCTPVQKRWFKKTIDGVRACSPRRVGGGASGIRVKPFQRRSAAATRHRSAVHTFAPKQNQTTKPASSDLARPRTATRGLNHQADRLLHLQRAIGNQALLRMAKTHPEELKARLTGTASPRLGHEFSRIPIHPPAAGVIQTKLAINKPGDEFEQEADRVAEQVMRMPELHLQRKCACGGSCAKCQDEADRLRMKSLGPRTAVGAVPAPPIVHEALRSPSQSLDGGTRAFMQPRFGREFGDVRVHTDETAARSAAAVRAQAYTVGRDIVFSAGQFAPQTPVGRRLLAHELTHVVQQDGGRGGVVQRAPSGQPTADSPAEVLGAIVHILSTRNMDIGLAQDVGPAGEQISAPGYYTDIKKSVHESGHVALLWEWYRIALASEPNGRGGRASIEGSAARRRIAKADAETRPLLTSVSIGRGPGGGLAAAYSKGVEDLTSRAAREEVTAQIDVGMARERLAPGHLEKKPESEEEETKSLLRQMIDLNLELVEASHKVSEHYGETIHEAAGKARELYDERLREYLTRVFKEHDVFAEAPEPREFEHASSRFVTGMAFVKGGLDAALAIMAVADPEKRAELFATHSQFFGKVGGAAQISKVMLQFASGGIAYYGYATYSVAKVTGNTKLAEEVLDLTVHRIGSVASGLYLVGALHGTAVLLDPEATATQKGEAAVETITNVVALAGTAGRWVPMLEGVAGWSGPIAAALAINWFALKHAAAAYQEAKEGIASLGGREYRDDAFDAATEVQEWMGRLAVTHALLAMESDEPRRKQLEKYAAQLPLGARRPASEAVLRQGLRWRGQAGRRGPGRPARPAAARHSAGGRGALVRANRRSRLDARSWRRSRPPSSNGAGSC